MLMATHGTWFVSFNSCFHHIWEFDWTLPRKNQYVLDGWWSRCQVITGWELIPRLGLLDSFGYFGLMFWSHVTKILDFSVTSYAISWLDEPSYCPVQTNLRSPHRHSSTTRDSDQPISPFLAIFTRNGSSLGIAGWGILRQLVLVLCSYTLQLGSLRRINQLILTAARFWGWYGHHLHVGSSEGLKSGAFPLRLRCCFRGEWMKHQPLIQC